LYFYGPSNIAFGFGFWGGATNETICAFVKNTSEDVWKIANQHCATITEDLFQSFLIITETALYFYLLFQIMMLLPTVLTALVWRIICCYGNQIGTNTKKISFNV
jgi:hypothetical protein